MDRTQGTMRDRRPLLITTAAVVAFGQLIDVLLLLYDLSGSTTSAAPIRRRITFVRFFGGKKVTLRTKILSQS